MKLFKALFAVALSTALLGMQVGVATAGRRSVSSQTFRWTFTRFNITGPWGTTECPVTLEGSYHARTYAKVLGSLIGYVTRAIFSVCTRGSATILTATLPWHAAYDGFGGTLPSYSWWQKVLHAFGFEVREPFGITCLLSGGEIRARQSREAGGAVTGVELTGRSPSTCGTEGTFSSSVGSVTVAGSATRITVTLI